MTLSHVKGKLQFRQLFGSQGPCLGQGQMTYPIDRRSSDPRLGNQGNLYFIITAGETLNKILPGDESSRRAFTKVYSPCCIGQ